MLSIGATTRIFFAAGATDMRKGFDGLQGLVLNVLKQDPLTGHLFLFVNRRRDRLKILYWDGDGLAIWYRKQESEDAHSNIFTGVEMHRTLNGIVDETRSTCF
jgi:transposase